jgi:hypothetical protein
MVSTYYYIYILVDTYYVVNGINIIKYLHTVNPHNGGNAWNMSRPCATVKRGLLWRYTLPYRATRRYLYATGLGNGFGNAHALTLYALAVIDWVWVWFGVCPIRFLHQKKYVFSCIVRLPVALQLPVFPFSTS